MPPTTMISRDRWGRPLLVPPGGGSRTAYTRVTTLAKTLDDTHNLINWAGRQVAVGMSRRPDLVALAASADGDRKSLDTVAEEAKAAAGSSSAANLGTAVHAFCEQLDLGQPPFGVPDDLKGDLRAYLQMRQRLGIGIDTECVEVFVADDELRVAGTADRVITIGGRRYIADIKTGSIAYGQQAIGIQLACYAGARRYDADTDRWGGGLAVSQEVGYIIHLPVGTGTASLVPVDLVAGRRLAHLAATVRLARRESLFGDAL